MAPTTIDIVKTVAERVRFLVDRFGGQTALERAAGLSVGQISRLLNGERKSPTVDVLDRIAQTTGANFEWLATGRGVAFGSGDRYPARPHAIAVFREEHAGKVDPDVLDDVVATISSMDLMSERDVQISQWRGFLAAMLAREIERRNNPAKEKADDERDAVRARASEERSKPKLN